MAFVNVEALMQQVSLERAVAFYRVELPEIHRIGDEIRMRCFLNCGRGEETGERALSIQPEHPAKIWRCHQSGCGKGGNLVSLCDLMKPGPHANGKPRGDRFKAVLADLQAMAAGEESPRAVATVQTEPRPTETKPRLSPGNVPLVRSENERARGLANLDAKFVVDPTAMSPKAASYFRHRSFLTPEACGKWRMGYLPRDTGGDHAGGTMRGKIVYPILSDNGEVLTWFGRDPEHEGRYHEWLVGGEQGNEPEKYHFVKNFRRGLELFGQHRLRDEEFRQRAMETGLLVVPGPNDVIALEAIGGAAVGLCATAVTAEQAEKLASFSRETGSVVTVMFGCMEEGELAARAVVVELAQRCPARLAWSPVMHGGVFKGRKTDSLTGEEWERLSGSILKRHVAK